MKNTRLSNIDVLASHGLVEIYDATVGAYRQVTQEDAQAMLANLQTLKETLDKLPASAPSDTKSTGEPTDEPA